MDQNFTDIARSKYILYFAIAIVVTLMISNTVSSKLFELGPFVFSVGILFFPITYIFNDVVTEVYGYRASRKIIWSAMAAIVFMSLMYAVTASIPPASFWQNQEAYETILGIVPRIALASIVAFFCGEFVNSYVLSRMKIWSNGKQLWKRTIGSTVAGEGVDTLLFFGIIFYGLIPVSTLVTLMWSSYLFKVLFEIVATPFTYKMVAWLKKEENIDTYDYGIDYNPFTIKL